MKSLSQVNYSKIVKTQDQVYRYLAEDVGNADRILYKRSVASSLFFKWQDSIKPKKVINLERNVILRFGVSQNLARCLNCRKSMFQFTSVMFSLWPISLFEDTFMVLEILKLQKISSSLSKFKVLFPPYCFFPNGLNVVIHITKMLISHFLRKLNESSSNCGMLRRNMEMQTWLPIRPKYQILDALVFHLMENSGSLQLERS